MNIFEGFQKNVYFWGYYNAIVDIFGVITKLNYLGVISILLSALSRIGIFLGVVNFQLFFWYADIPNIFEGKQ